MYNSRSRAVGNVFLFFLAHALVSLPTRDNEGRREARAEHSLRCLRDVIAPEMARIQYSSDSVHAGADPAVWKVDSTVDAVEVVCVRREIGCNLIDPLDEEEEAMFFA